VARARSRRFAVRGPERDGPEHQGRSIKGLRGGGSTVFSAPSNGGEFMRRISLLLLAPAVLMLTGCGFIDNPWGRSKREAEEAERLEEARAVNVPIQNVQRAEIGRTRNGFLITAYGAAPGFGYTFPVLQPRRDGAPGIDGYVDYDFMATEPQ